METAECAQIGVVHRLNAERNAIDAGGAIPAQPLCLDTCRVRFEGDFNGIMDWPKPRDDVEDRTDGRGLHQRRRAAPEKNTANGPPRSHCRLRRKFLFEGRQIARFVNPVMPDMRIEIAIRAFRGTEGPVHIDPEAGIERRLNSGF